jgi:Flp pilus assembly protein TadD
MYRIFLTYIFCFTAVMGADSASAVTRSYESEYSGKYSEAYDAIATVSRDNPKEYFFALRAAWLSYLSGKYAVSLRHYQDALLLKPDSIEPRLGQLLPLIALGKYDQAEMAAKAILRTDPKNYTARLQLAYIYYLRGNFIRAETHYAELAAEYPSDATVLMGFGWAQLKQGKKSAARESFGRVQLMSPTNTYAKEGLKWAR